MGNIKKNDKILILGAGGVLGRNILKSLSKKYQVTGIVSTIPNDNSKNKKNIQYVVFNPSNFEVKFLSNFIKNFNVVVNCIGEISDISKMNSSNYLIVKKITKSLMKHKNKHLIHISTCAIYGENEDSIIFESSEAKPLDEYQKSKWKAECHIIKNSKNNFFFTIIRPSQVLGIGMNNASLKKIYFYLKLGVFFLIKKTNPIFSYIFVNDLCLIVEKCISLKKSRNKIFLTSNFIYLKKLINIIKDYFQLSKKTYTVNISFVKFAVNFFEFFHISFSLNSRALKALVKKNMYSSFYTRKTLGINYFRNINYSNINFLLDK